MRFKPVYLSNGEVAWEIPSDHNIDGRFLNRVYLPPQGWAVVMGKELKRFFPGVCGELRIKEQDA